MHAVEKSYLALVRGDARRFPVKEGVIAAPLSIDDGRVRVQAASGSGGSGSSAQAEEPGHGGKAAHTAWEVLASSVSRSIRRVCKGSSPQSLKSMRCRTSCRYR